MAMTIQRRERTVLAPDPPNADASISRDAAELGIRLLDDAYMAWLIAESETEQTLAAWRERAGTSADRHRAHLAAIDREEAAARDLQRLHEIASPYLQRYAEASESSPAAALER